jgi:predicted transcriptional regulator
MKSLSIAVLFCIIWPHIIAGLTIQDFARGNNLFTAAIYKVIVQIYKINTFARVFFYFRRLLKKGTKTFW